MLQVGAAEGAVVGEVVGAELGEVVGVFVRSYKTIITKKMSLKILSCMT